MSKSLVGLVALIAINPINYDHKMFAPGKLVPVRPDDVDQLLDVKAAREADQAEIDAYLAEPEKGGGKAEGQAVGGADTGKTDAGVVAATNAPGATTGGGNSDQGAGAGTSAGTSGAASDQGGAAKEVAAKETAAADSTRVKVPAKTAAKAKTK